MRHWALLHASEREKERKSVRRFSLLEALLQASAANNPGGKEPVARGLPRGLCKSKGSLQAAVVTGYRKGLQERDVDRAADRAVASGCSNGM